MGEYTLSTIPGGHKTLTYADGNKEIKIHSSYDPLLEARRGADSFTPGRANCVVVFGLGLGYHLAELRKRHPHCLFLCVEKDRAVVNLALSVFPGLLDGVPLVCGAADIGPALEEIDMSLFRGMANYIHRPSYGLDRGHYDTVLLDIHRFISSKLSDLLTRFEFESRWIENIFRNLHKAFTARPAAELFGRFSGMPGIIVSAGPSLRKNAAYLKKLRDRAVIVAVDTAFKALTRQGIVPHLVMTIDAQKHSIRHFQGCGPGPTVLLADLVSFPRVTEIWRGPASFSTTAKYYTDRRGVTKREPTPVMDWIERYMHPLGDIQSGGSVATSALDLLLNMGCRPIILVGQDLAYTGREIHTSGTHHNDDWTALTGRFLNLDTINQRVIRKRKIKYVESYGGGGTVISDYVFDLYRGWFEDSALRLGFPLVNATGGGARIRNTVERSLHELADELPPLSPAPEEALAAAAGRTHRPEKLKSAMTAALEEIRGIEAALESAGPAPPDPDRVLNMIEEKGLLPLFSPLLRKTFSYLARHPDLAPEKAASMMKTDLASAARKLSGLMGPCAARLGEIGGDG